MINEQISFVFSCIIQNKRIFIHIKEKQKHDMKSLPCSRACCKILHSEMEEDKPNKNDKICISLQSHS